MREKLKSYYPLILFVVFLVFIQGISLFRSYPLNPTCGRVINLFLNANVLINCDSAVFMRDAQNPLRLFDGQSVYQDRPAHAVLVWIVGNVLKVINFPNEIRSIIGNAGLATPYESIYYVSYLGINLLIILTAALLGVSFVLKNRVLNPFEKGYLLPVLVTLVITANELTKSFFWTPHSQMFNILLPIEALFLLSKRKSVASRGIFLLTCSLVSVQMFFYPLFGILFAILFFSAYSKFLIRVSLIAPFALVYIIYPKALNLVGGDYTNFVVERYRQYVWINDSIKTGTLTEDMVSNLERFTSTFPIFPTLIMVFSGIPIIFVMLKGRKYLNLAFELIPFLCFFLLYISALSIMGYYSRRLTLGPIIFLELVLLKLGLDVWSTNLVRVKQALLFCLSFVLLGSWIWTNGPLS
jgi:hypothetical protein